MIILKRKKQRVTSQLIGRETACYSRAQKHWSFHHAMLILGCSFDKTKDLFTNVEREFESTVCKNLSCLLVKPCWFDIHWNQMCCQLGELYIKDASKLVKSPVTERATSFTGEQHWRVEDSNSLNCLKVIS